MQLKLSKDLTALKRAAEAKVDGEAEALRQRFVTPGSGQAMTYLVKQEQARQCIADPDPDPANYPLLAATIGIERDEETGQIAQNVTEVAQIVLSVLDQWMQVAAMIEQLRLGAKAAIRTATTPAAIEAAAQVDWQSIAGDPQ